MELVVGSSSNAVKSLVGKLGGLLAQEYTLIQGVRDDIQYINDELASMQAFLNRLKRASGHDEQRRDWMKQVREVAYVIEDCIDDIGHRLGREPRGTDKLVYLRRAWYLLTTLYARRCIATEISNLKLRAQHVSDRRTRYGVESPAGGDGHHEATKGPGDRPTPPPQLFGTREPVGMGDAINELEPWFKQNTGQLRSFLAIFGFGGLGKTTLAMALYRKFGDAFDCRASVQASQKFNHLALLRSLVKQFHEQQAGASETPLDGIDEWGEERLKNELNKQHKKRYLILVDDIWSVSTWEKISDSLPEGGSIVVTTRFKSVAEACRRQQGRVYEHKPLSEESSYKLFSEIISSVCDDPRPHETQTVLKRCCGGLPLAIVVVAGLVASKLKSERKSTFDHQLSEVKPTGLGSNLTTEGEASKQKSEVESTFDHQLSEVKPTGLGSNLTTESVASKQKSEVESTLYHQLSEVEKPLRTELGSNLTTEGVTQILDHCYKQLPADLKTCLLYSSMFPKGRSIRRKRLIRKWMAEGFIIEKHGKTAEEVAEDCFNELITRNLIRPVDNSSNGKVKNYEIHDMVLEYIVSKSSDENFITVVGGHWQTPFPSYKVRRLSVQRSDQQAKGEVEKMKLSHVRSLTALESFKVLHSSWVKFQILQVLDLEGCKDLSDRHQLKKICKMHQLKYLSLRRTDTTEIPSNIGSLEYLEVLDIRETKVRKLPKSVERLYRMAHLLAGSKSKRIALTLTEGITKMTSLQTLSGIEICGSSSAAKGGSFVGARVLTTARTEKIWVKRVGKIGRRTCICAGLCRRKAEEHALVQQSGGKAARTSLHKVPRPLAALQNLTNLKKLSIYKLTDFTNGDNESLLSAIEHLSSCSLKFFAIDDSFTGFLDLSLGSSQAPPEHLHTLELSGMLSDLPVWIGRLHNLEKLTLSLTSLTTDILPVLGTLPELFSLIFSLDAENKDPSVFKILHKNTMNSGGKIFVPARGFKKLKLLRFSAPVLPPLSFLEEAMPELQRLELRFRMVEGVYGLENLTNLQQVFITVSSQAPEDAKKKVSQIKGLASKIGNAPSVVVDEYNESSKTQ